VRVWIDVSNSPQVPFFRPLIALLEKRGHAVEVTTREYAQTIELLELHGIPHEVVGPPHGGGGAVG
jgi:predicted glycosyltransferase